MKITINNVPFKIEFVDSSAKKMNPDNKAYNLGLTEYIDPAISIRKGMDKSVTRSTVLHELTHAFIFAYGYHIKGEESVCDFICSQADAIMQMAEDIMKEVK